MRLRSALFAVFALTGTALLSSSALAETISIVAGSTGRDLEVLQTELKEFVSR